MDQRTRAYVASGAIVAFFVLVQLGALALVAPFEAAGYQAVDDPQDPTNSVAYVGAILVVTGLMLAAIKYDVTWLIRLGMVFAGAYISLFVLRVVVPPVVTLPVAGAAVNVLAWLGAGALGVTLFVYPEWYVIDAAGVLMGAGGAAIFGISFGVLPAILLLVVLAVYDAISVYGTEHMLTLASGVMDLKVPIVLVVPLSLSYSYLDEGAPDHIDEGGTDDEGVSAGEADGDADTRAADGDAETTPVDSGAETADGATPGDDDPEAADGTPSGDDDSETAADSPGDVLDREALFIGLGDAVIPTVLVASAAFFAPDSVPTVGLLGLEASLPAVTAMVGTSAGLVVLLWMVLKGRAHAGLPLLNGGTIAGYLLGALASGLTLVQALGIESYV
jgi:presenilin-like A22 family membrane protease